MNDCPDLAILVDLESAAGFRGLEVIRHVSGCADCRALLADLETVHSEAGSTAALDEQHVQAILRSITEEGQATPAPARVGLLGAIFALSLLTATALALFGAIVSGAAPSPVAVGVGSVIVALTATWRFGHRGAGSHAHERVSPS